MTTRCLIGVEVGGAGAAFAAVAAVAAAPPDTRAAAATIADALRQDKCIDASVRVDVTHDVQADDLCAKGLFGEQAVSPSQTCLEQRESMAGCPACGITATYQVPNG